MNEPDNNTRHVKGPDAMSSRRPSIFWTIAVLFGIGSAVSVITYPEIFLTFKASFMLWSDYIIEYVLSFVLTNLIFQGGIQLWDYFGQLPMTYAYATFGLFKFQNVVTALLYYVLSPFTDDTGRLFYMAFAWGNFLSHLLLRIVGIFLVLNVLVKNRWIVLIGATAGALFFSQPAFLWGTYFMSFNPIFMYFVLRFAQTLEARYLAGAFLFFMISIGNGIIHTGYMYVGFNTFVVSCLVWSLVCNRPAWGRLKDRLKNFGSYLHWRNIALLLLVAALIAGPYVYIVKFCLHDISFDMANSRISRMFSPEFYFKKLEIALAEPGNFFKDILSFDWSTNPTVFFGWMLAFLAVVGLVLSPQSIKWAFGGAVLLLWLLNHPRETLNIGLIGHWVNVLTNPLKTLARSYFVSSYVMLAYLLIPLAMMGAQELLNLWRRPQFARARWNVIGLVMLLFAVTSIPGLPRACGTYVGVMAAFVLGGIVIVNIFRERVLRLFVMLIVMLTLADVAIIINYSKRHFLTNCNRKPVVLDVSPQVGSIGYDFENPALFPFRNTHETRFIYSDENFLWIPRATSSNFCHVTNQGLNFQFLSPHAPRHAEFESWLNDAEMWTYVNQNRQTAFVAPGAVKAAPGLLSRICAAGLSHDVIMVDDPSGRLKLPEMWNPSTKPSPEPKVDLKTVVTTTSEFARYSREDDLIVFRMALPPDFPKHLATSWFSGEERYLRFLMERKDNDWIEFTHAQGELIRPYTFDVQNIKEGMLMAAIPKDNFVARQRLAFLYPSANNSGVVRIWRSQYDHLGMDYRADRNGWLVFHYPYDKKWRITLDGNRVDFYRVNRSFIGFPITQGDHKILIEYWPDSSLRFWLLVSAILTTLGLPLLLYFALRWEQDTYRSLE